MLAYLGRRAGQTVIVLLGASIIVFSLVHIAPGGPVEVLFADQNATEAQRAEFSHALGLDRPLFAQYLSYLGGLLHGDLGTSIQQHVPVRQLVGAALPNTVELTLAALLVAILIAVPLAVVAARRPGTLWDRGGTIASLFGISMPSFWLGIMLILAFAVKLTILPASGVVDADSEVPVRTGFSVLDAVLAGNASAFGSALLHLLLPAVTLGAAVAATIARVLRSSLIEVGEQEHVEALHARGLSAASIIRHLLRNALPATVVVVGVRIGALLGGAIIVETVFSWPGMGWLIVQSIGQRDYPVVQGAVLTIAVLVALVNFATDLLHAWLDPRVQLVGGTR